MAYDPTASHVFLTMRGIHRKINPISHTILIFRLIFRLMGLHGTEEQRPEVIRLVDCDAQCHR